MSKQRTENMTVSELRIGNFIRWGVHDCKVKSFTRADINKEIFIYTDKTIGAIDISDFNPIELTPEWLERAGWNYYNGKSSGDMTMDTSCKIDLDWVDGRMKLKGHYEPSETYRIIPIKHVHQLQNLYYALIGTELEFNIPNET